MLAKLKFDATIPFALERKLINDFGFVVYSRLHGHNVIMVKHANKKKNAVPPFDMAKLVKDIQPPTTAVAVIEDYNDPDQMLTDVYKTELIRKVNKIVDFYPNPAANVASIRTRIKNVIAITNGPLGKKYLANWLEQYYPEPADPVAEALKEAF